jgi:predicted membrane protein
LQYLVFSLIPFFLLGINTLFNLRDRVANVMIWTAATMLLIQVLLMRWNVVVGGQMVSKSMRGFSSYFPGFWEKEGLAVAVVIFTLPFVILWVFHKVVPLFPNVDGRRR